MTPTRPPAMRNLHDVFLDQVDQALDAMTLGEGGSLSRAERSRRRRHAPRYRRVIVAYDGSEGAEHALVWARDLARSEHASALLVASAYALPVLTSATALAYAWYAPIQEGYTEARARMERVNGAVVRDLRNARIEARGHLLEGSASSQIARLAFDHHADLIVTGGHRHVGAGRFLLGSTATGLLDRSPCSVLIARGPPRPERVLVATDGSNVGHRAVAHALAHTARTGAELVIQHVLEYPEEATDLRPDDLRKAVTATLELPPAPPRVRYVMDVGHASQRILERAAQENVGLIVLGSHGKGAIERAIVGSTSRRVANEATASVLVVKEGVDD